MCLSCLKTAVLLHFAVGSLHGAPEFVTGLENLLGRKIARRAPGRKSTIEGPVAEQLDLL